jgi:hypothetical protein
MSPESIKQAKTAYLLSWWKIRVNGIISMGKKDHRNNLQPGVVAHAYNHNYSGGTDQGI